ncbi:hypothetical protein GPY51_21350 [Photorhabdus laumondii subsp. laumondii]|uniref:Photorhabdus luminescens subsp. laumondii TTO1 complete genome segment 10/17 n=2 Tax=Photorhabdus laumondii subsp. laumondii TaxID=141679 RepID=Q7N317_PHOLL|nr:hypothetical protein [Photorhabdus laumondii]AXG47937.1 hypothetical protein PluTT01m_14910 [Photorhabdus laumondii subsp. laumondii]MCC8384950.1 hypothetical protein [Photorhabdus laumondii]NDK96818.1 hypothetical protein [Photorhabdus laumondii subsp. laumondii]NDL36542.1 hypothetical protein [Photorhabdus laumondii subsp. laumondii]NDL41224.1 hypothetical protein [Photorhabdus laumondii subsp. laumondii]
MSIIQILVPVIYFVGVIAAFIIFILIEKRVNDPEEFGVILFMSFIWPLLIILMPIVFGFFFLNEIYNQFVGRRS